MYSLSRHGRREAPSAPAYRSEGTRASPHRCSPRQSLSATTHQRYHGEPLVCAYLPFKLRWLSVRKHLIDARTFSAPGTVHARLPQGPWSRCFQRRRNRHRPCDRRRYIETSSPLRLRRSSSPQAGHVREVPRGSTTTDKTRFSDPTHQAASHESLSDSSDCRTFQADTSFVSWPLPSPVFGS